MRVSDYSKPNVSDKVLRIIVSYTDYVKEMFGMSNETSFSLFKSIS